MLSGWGDGMKLAETMGYVLDKELSRVVYI